MPTEKGDDARDDSRPTLFGAITSFGLSIVLVVVLVALVGKHTESGGNQELSGIYVADDAERAQSGVVSPRIGVRFLTEGKAELRVGDKLFEAIYRAEGDRVVIEPIMAAGETSVWIFDREEDRLVSPEVILERLED